MTAAGWTVGVRLHPVHNVLKMAAVPTALAPDEEAFHHMVAHSTHTGTLPASITDPALVAHGSLAVAAVDVEGGGGLVHAVDGAAGAQLDHLVGDVP